MASRLTRIMCVCAPSVTLIIGLVVPANAEQKGWQVAGTSGSDVLISVLVDNPYTSCLIYSTSAQDFVDDYFIQAGLYNCTGWPDHPDECPAGRYTFGEQAHNNMYHCSHEGGWVVGSSVGVQVSATATPSTWKGYVAGTPEVVRTGFNHLPTIYVWDEWATGTQTCYDQTQSHVAFRDWEYKSGGTWSYVVNPAVHYAGPSRCLTLGFFDSTGLWSSTVHGFEVAKHELP